jgi:hypothetical protein
MTSTATDPVAAARELIAAVTGHPTEEDGFTLRAVFERETGSEEKGQAA